MTSAETSPASVAREGGLHICFFCSAHLRVDTRVFEKYCLTTVAGGHRTTLIVADGHGNEIDRGVEILDAGVPSGDGTLMRLKRFVATTLKVYTLARRTRADVYHFHDPELLPFSMLLALTGKPVIYDVHEDYRDLLCDRAWLWGGVGPVLGHTLRGLEKLAAYTWLKRIVTATERISGYFPPAKTLVIRNYTDLAEFPNPRSNHPVTPEKPFTVCLIGGLIPNRCVHLLVEAIDRCKEDVRLVLGGPFEPEGYQEQCEALPGWAKTEYLPGGRVSREQVALTMQSSDAGIVIEVPIEHNAEAMPVKLFEYMAAGIPSIVSNFDIMDELVIDNDIGLKCDSMDPDSIANAIDTLAGDRDRAMQMGIKAREIAASTYSWNSEATRLLAMYDEITKR